MASKIFQDCGSSNFKLGLCSGFGSRDVLEKSTNGEGGRAGNDKCCMAAVTARQFAIRNNSDVATSGRDSVSRRGWGRGLGRGTSTWQLDRDQ